MRQRFWNVGFVLLAAIPCIAIAPASVAEDHEQDVDPEIIYEMLDTAGRVMRSSYGPCPHLGLRVRPDPVADRLSAGYVLVVFDVSRYGKPINAEIIDASVDVNQQEQAIEIINLFSFRPLIQDNTAQVFENWIERIDFLEAAEQPDISWPAAEGYMAGRCRQ